MPAPSPKRSYFLAFLALGFDLLSAAALRLGDDLVSSPRLEIALVSSSTDVSNSSSPTCTAIRWIFLRNEGVKTKKRREPMVGILDLFVRRTNPEISTLVIMQSFPLGPGLGDVQAFQGGHLQTDGTDGFVHFDFHGLFDIHTPRQFEGHAYIGQWVGWTKWLGH